MRQLLEPCLEWRGAIDRNGYGVSGVRSLKAHRYVYIKAFGPQPKLDVHHICGNRICINLEHLIAVSRGEHIGITGRRSSCTHNTRGWCTACKKEYQKRYWKTYRPRRTTQ